MNNVENFNNNICCRERPRIQIAKKYILSVTRNINSGKKAKLCNKTLYYEMQLAQFLQVYFETTKLCFCVVFFNSSTTTYYNK